MYNCSFGASSFPLYRLNLFIALGVVVVVVFSLVGRITQYNEKVSLSFLFSCCVAFDDQWLSSFGGDCWRYLYKVSYSLSWLSFHSYGLWTILNRRYGAGNVPLSKREWSK